MQNPGASVVGIGQTQYAFRGQLAHRGTLDLALEAISRAADDAGLELHDIDGFASFSGDSNDGGILAFELGIPDLRYSAMAWGGGGANALGPLVLAADAVRQGSAHYVVVVRSIIMDESARYGRSLSQRPIGRFSDIQFSAPYGLLSPAQTFALAARRHMALYGTTSEQFGRVAVAQRFHATRNPMALRRDPITLEDHRTSRMIADPIRKLDCCQESDGACAYIVTTNERALDLRQPPVRVLSAVMGGEPRYPSDPANQNMRTHDLATGGQKSVASRAFRQAGLTPADVQVALLFDNFTPQVIMALEDLGFCAAGEGGPFVESEGITWPDGRLPINTHGGLHSEAYVHMNHVLEAVRQMRGTSTSQVADAEVAIVAGTAGRSPTSVALLGR